MGKYDFKLKLFLFKINFIREIELLCIDCRDESVYNALYDLMNYHKGKSMKEPNQANFAAVLTWETLEDLEKQGGSGNWKTVLNRAKRVDYLLLVGNKRDNPDAPYKHGEGFLLAKVSGIHERKLDNRKVFLFQEYAEISLPKCWNKLTVGANPITYYDNWSDNNICNAAEAFAKIGLNFEELEWKKLPEKQKDTEIEVIEGEISENIAEQSNHSDVEDFLTIPEAKRRLAKTLGVDESCIFITING